MTETAAVSQPPDGARVSVVTDGCTRSEWQGKHCSRMVFTATDSGAVPTRQSEKTISENNSQHTLLKPYSSTYKLETDCFCMANSYVTISATLKILPRLRRQIATRATSSPSPEILSRQRHQSAPTTGSRPRARVHQRRPTAAPEPSETAAVRDSRYR